MQIVIPGELTDLNAFIKKINYNRFAGASVKKSETERVYWECKKELLSKIKKYPVMITFSWFSKDCRKDLDNVCFGKKFILDGLVMAGVLENDSRKFVAGFQDLFFIDAKHPRVEVLIKSCHEDKSNIAG